MQHIQIINALITWQSRVQTHTFLC